MCRRLSRPFIDHLFGLFRASSSPPLLLPSPEILFFFFFLSFVGETCRTIWRWMLSLPPFLSLSSWSAPSTKRRRGIFSSWSPPKGKFIFPDVIRHPPKKRERKKENLFIRWKLFIPGWLHLTLVSRPKMAALILLGSLFFLDIMSYYRHISLFWPRVRDPFNEVHGDNADLFHPCVWKRGWVTDVDQPRYWNSYHLLSQSYQIRELNDFSPLSPFFWKIFHLRQRACYWTGTSYEEWVLMAAAGSCSRCLRARYRDVCQLESD